MDKRDFFISYNKVDKTWAKWIAGILEEEGYSCYIQAWDFRPGSNFVVDMQNALVQSERFIAVLSQDYLTSLYCQAEWAAAFTKDPNSEKRLLIPVRISDVEPKGFLAAIIYIDLFGIDENEAKKRLINGVDVENIPRNRPSFPGTPKVRFPGSLPFHNLPFSRNNYFTGRENIFEKMCAGFESGSAISLTQAITGLGGLGKTQTALEYAYRYAHKYEWIWWVTAESEPTVLMAYKKFATRMKLLHEEQQDRELIIETVLNWMDANDKWLFIYDNVDDVSRDTDWWPRNNRANILITTRNKHIQIGENIDIAVFEKNEAVDFLEKRTGINKDPANALILAERLGYLPLALVQAAAYININGSTYIKYLSLLEECGLKVLEAVDGILDYSLSLAATLEISIKRINQEEARQLLYLCAYMASEDINEALFRENTELLPQPLGEMMSDRLAAGEVWKQLTRYSLLEKQEDGKGYSMHRLLQEIVRNKINHEPQWAQCCLSLFRKVYNFEFGNIASQNQFLQLTTHVEAFLNYAVAILSGDEEKKKIANLYAMGGFGNLHLGNYPQALEWNKKALDIYEKVLGKEHPDTAATYNNIAGVYDSQGDYPKALEWYQKALAIDEKVSGKEHPDTATTYNNIAAVYGSQSDYPLALKWYKKALDICEKVLGKEHHDTATTYNNIGEVYRSQGDYPQALEWYRKAYDIFEKVLGPDHPSTKTVRENMESIPQK